jgi:hypothetical protein
MPQLFPRSANDYARMSLALLLFLLAGAAWAGAMLHKSGYRTGEDAFLHQSIPFSHEHHVRGLGLDCRYCHTSVEVSSSAGMPPTATCMNCHRQIWTNAELLEPVRESWRTGVPIQWERVHDLPDFVYFNHGVHVTKGIGCSECHGNVAEMPLMRQVASLDMQWCLECHQNPEARVRPRERVFDMYYDPAAPSAEDLALVGLGPGAGPGATLARQGEGDLGQHGEAEHDELEDGDMGEAAHGSDEGPGEDPHAGVDLEEFRRRLAEEYDVRSLTSCSVCHR